jgi:hypothetical protein
MEHMTSREILDTIDRALERAAHQAARQQFQPLPMPSQIERPGKRIGQMSGQEVLEAIDRGLAEAARAFASDVMVPS